jgi:hypothetical protein
MSWRAGGVSPLFFVPNTGPTPVRHSQTENYRGWIVSQRVWSSMPRLLNGF